MAGLNALLAAALLMQGGPSFLDQRIGDRDPKAPAGLADLTLGQMMQLTSLPKPRIDEARCTGFLLSGKYKGPASQTRKSSVRAAVTEAIANDSRFDTKVSGHFVTMMVSAASEDPPSPEECKAFLAMAESATPITLSPLLKSAAVDPVLAACHARYRVAADRADAADRDNLANEAERARSAALKGKSGADLAAAEQALEEAVVTESSAAQAPSEQAMSALVMCQPAMARAGA